MTITLRKSIRVLSVTFLLIQTLFMSIGTVYAETLVEQTEDKEQVELPDIKNYLALEEERNPRFFFHRSRLEGTVGEQMNLTFFSDQEVSTTTITLPTEAEIIKENLPAGVFVQQGESPYEWLIESPRPRHTFDFHVVFETIGNYEIAVAEATATVEISELEEPMKELEQDIDDDQQALDSEEENEVQEGEGDYSNAPSYEEIPIQPELKDQLTDDEQTEDELEEKSTFAFDGESVEVRTFEQLRLAIADSAVGTIEVRSNLTRSGTGVASAIGSLNRTLRINGNGFVINFGADNGSLDLASLADQSETLRVENATITKAGNTPIFNAQGSGLGWTLELENITEGTSNASRLALIPEGNVLFTGGLNNFIRTTVTNLFIQAKQIEARGGAQVTITRGNAGILFSPAEIEGPKIIVRESSTLAITTASGTNNPIDLRGINAEVSVSDESSLTIQTQGTIATATNTTNNALVMSGNNPTLSITERSALRVSTTNAKRGITLVGSTPTITIREADLNVTSATAAGIHANGDEAVLGLVNSDVNVTSTTGRGLSIESDRAILEFENSEVTVSGQTATRILIQGMESQIISKNTKGHLVSTTGYGLRINDGERGIGSEIIIDKNSEWSITSSGSSQNVSIISPNPTLHVTNHSSLTVSSAQGTTVNFLLQGTNPELKIENQATVSVTAPGTTAAATNTSNIAMSLSGSNPSVYVLRDSELKVAVTANAKQGLHLNGSEPKVQVDQSHLDLQGFTGQMLRLAGNSPSLSLNDSTAILNATTASTVMFQGANAELSAMNSEIDLPRGTTGNGLDFANANSKVELNQTILTINTTSGTGLNMSGSNNGITLTHASEVMMNAVSGNNIEVLGNDASLTVLGGSSLVTMTGESDSIRLVGNAPTIKITGMGTEVEATSRHTSNLNQVATIFVGSSSFETRIENYLVEVGDHAKLTVNADRSSGLVMRGNNGRFDVYNQADIHLISGSYNMVQTTDSNASLRFMRSGPGSAAGDNTFNIDNARMRIEKGGGNAATVRMYGSNNQINVLNGGEFLVTNPGTGAGLDGGTGGRNQGVHYTGVITTNNGFTVSDPGSVVKINASSGAAIDMESGLATVEASNGGYFEASGRTSTAAAGIFNAGTLTVDFDNPLFMDFRNNRVGGGNIFNNNPGSLLEAKNSDLAVWRNGSNLDGDPDLNFPTLDFTFTGTNFNTLGTTNKPEVLNTTTFGTTGLTLYSRLSSNNARWVIVDELRVPTNADKRIYGHVSIPVGLEDSRSAWDDEATVIVEIEHADGSTREYTAVTKGHTNEEPGISIYGEAPRGGVFEVVLDEFLQRGDKVRVKEGKLTSGELSQGYENIILTETVNVFPIVPPAVAQFSSSVIAIDSTTIQGYSQNREAEVTATINGDAIDTKEVTIGDDGKFTLDLNDLSLEEDDEIQVFLRDNKGSAEEAGVVNPPKTNDTRGNINPTTKLAFRDRTFEPATILIVRESGPFSPVDPLDPDVEVDPENKPILPENQGMISIDFVSQFHFGKVAIQSTEVTYEALPQRLLNSDGTVNELEERPNYVQISDRRGETERGGWRLSATLAAAGLRNSEDEQLKGAQIRLDNQEIATTSTNPNMDGPEILRTGAVLVPGAKLELLAADLGEGQGTWIYRFGNQNNARSSVKLDVPQGANPRAMNYQGAIDWELSVVPSNE